MSDKRAHALRSLQLREMSLSRWENEGGAGIEGRQVPAGQGQGQGQAQGQPPPLANAELVQLHMRVIALEGLVTALLIDASHIQLDRVRGMADYIQPRPGFTDHPMTIRAAAQMVDLAERAGRLRAYATADFSADRTCP